ncbi:nitrate- and nitrite sensing domain-containing protein [Frankia sp. ArI3]|uniref:sensor histidine kinase n=1 Tax=Frankia sp. ArI3 TaxID=1858 RepID=UPI002107F81D|nr:nitrate- and nitrite sensing domain-containing protein [Frankia sp. ArI3]
MASSTGIAADPEPTSAPGLPVDTEDGGQRDDRPAAPPDPAGSGLARLRRAATNPTNWRVRTKLIAILAVPVVAILVYSSIEASAVLTSTRDVNRISDLTEISRSASTLAHALQTERTYSTGFVASGPVGSRDAAAVPPSQAAVNDAYQAYKAVANGRRGSFGSEVRRALDDVQTRMDSLPAKRQTIQRVVDPKAVQTTFQPIIDSLVNLVQLIPQGNDDQQLDDGVNTAYFLMSGTELLAQQQALVYSLLPRGSNQLFTEGDYREFLSAETQRARERDDLENVAGPAQHAIYNPTIDTENNGDIRNTQIYVEEVLDAPIGQPLTVIESEKWNRATQETIDTSTAATDKLLALVDDRVDTLRGNIQHRALLSGLLIVLILAAALLSALVVARSLVRPLLALRTAALDIADRRLPEAVRRLRDSTDQDIDDSIEPVGINTDEEVGEVARAFDEVHREAIRLASEQASLRNNVNAMFVNLSRRSQGLVERQLRLIDDLENREQDPDQLSNLFKLDHLATRMRRNNESLLVLAGTDTARRWTHPVPLNEVVLAAISEVEQYTRVKQTSAAPVSIAGNGVSDVVHLVAELLENATSYSPPVTEVLVTSHSLGPGAGAMIEIEDQGIGMPAKELERVNERLANPPVVDVSVSRTMGLFAVGRLAGRHGIRVQLRESASGGITAVVRLPAKLVTGDSAAGTAPGRPPALNRPSTAPAIGGPGPGGRPAERAERPSAERPSNGVAPDRANGAATPAGTGASNGMSNGHRPESEPATRENVFDDSSGPRRFPNTGPFPLTGPLAAQLGSDRTGPMPTTDRRNFGLEEFSPAWTTATTATTRPAARRRPRRPRHARSTAAPHAGLPSSRVLRRRTGRQTAPTTTATRGTSTARRSTSASGPATTPGHAAARRHRPAVPPPAARLPAVRHPVGSPPTPRPSTGAGRRPGATSPHRTSRAPCRSGTTAGRPAPGRRTPSPPRASSPRRRRSSPSGSARTSGTAPITTHPGSRSSRSSHARATCSPGLRTGPNHRHGRAPSPPPDRRHRPACGRRSARRRRPVPSHGPVPSHRQDRRRRPRPAASRSRRLPRSPASRPRPSRRPTTSKPRRSSTPYPRGSSAGRRLTRHRPSARPPRPPRPPRVRPVSRRLRSRPGRSGVPASAGPSGSVVRPVRPPSPARVPARRRRPSRPPRRRYPRSRRRTSPRLPAARCGRGPARSPSPRRPSPTSRRHSTSRCHSTSRHSRRTGEAGALPGTPAGRQPSRCASPAPVA